MQSTDDTAGHPLPSPGLPDAHLLPTPEPPHQEKKQSKSLTCFLVRVFPVRSLMYRAISSLRPAGRARAQSQGNRGPGARDTSGPPPSLKMLVPNEGSP